MDRVDDLNIDELSVLLDDFGALKIHDERPKTFVEIAKPTGGLELVCSSILAFFLNPEESHGLGTLVLDALANAGNKYKTFEIGKIIGGNVSVECEVSTGTVITDEPKDKRKKIDILIQSEDYVIVIENKTAVNPRIDNPFDVYAAHQNKIAEENGIVEEKRKPKILLTATPSSAGSKEGFDNITHARLVQEIRSRLGRYVAEADTRCLTLFLDFLNTLDSLTEGTRMDPKLIGFLATRDEDVHTLLDQVNNVRTEMRGKTKQLRDLIDISDHEGVTQDFFRETVALYDDLAHKVPVAEGLTIQVDTSLFPKGWEIYFWPVEGSYSDMIEVLRRLEIPLEEYEVDGGVYYRDNFVHKYNDDLDGIRGLLQGVIDKLAAEGSMW